MSTLEEFRAALTAIAERSLAIRSKCTNEESTKHFLILPLIGALGYDFTDPNVVQPEFAADFRADMRERVDYVVMRDGVPAIAVECKKVGTSLTENRGQLRAYFTALQTVRLGILTNGIAFEFFVDSETPNIMDAEPFLTLNLDGAIPDDVLEALLLLTHARFDPYAIAEAADERLVARRLRNVLVEEVRDPSYEFCKVILKRIGIVGQRQDTIRARYASQIRTAFEEALVLPVIERLGATMAARRPEADATPRSNNRIVTTDRELAVYRYVCRRLAFLVTDEHQFTAVESIHHQDQIGKFVVYYKKKIAGRLFDFIEGRDGYDKFIFPEPFGEIVTNAMRDIDEPLRVIFTQRVRELGAPKLSDTRMLESA